MVDAVGERCRSPTSTTSCMHRLGVVRTERTFRSSALHRRSGDGRQPGASPLLLEPIHPNGHPARPFASTPSTLHLRAAAEREQALGHRCGVGEGCPGPNTPGTRTPDRSSARRPERVRVERLGVGDHLPGRRRDPRRRVNVEDRDVEGDPTASPRRVASQVGEIEAVERRHRVRRSGAQAALKSPGCRRP
jgi:hypothetical protein